MAIYTNYVLVYNTNPELLDFDRNFIKGKACVYVYLGNTKHVFSAVEGGIDVKKIKLVESAKPLIIKHGNDQYIFKQASEIEDMFVVQG